MDELWQRFLHERDGTAREKLIIHYAPLVKRVVGRMLMTLPSSLDYSDLISYGIIGLIDALEKFDPFRGVKFETYAVSRIRGAILDELRALDWIPRSVRQKAKNLEKAYGELETSLGRSASDAEIAEYLGITESELAATIEEVNRTAIISIDEDLFGSEGETYTLLENLEDKDLISPLEKIVNDEIYENLANAIDDLPEREKIVISLYYYDGLTLKEIGKVLQISESRVCQLHARAMLRLKGKLLNTYGNDVKSRKVK